MPAPLTAAAPSAAFEAIWLVRAARIAFTSGPTAIGLICPEHHLVSRRSPAAGVGLPVHGRREHWRRFVSPEMSVAVASVFACPGTDCSPRPPRKRCCGGTARTPGTSGTWPSSSTRTGTRAGRAPRATWSSADSSPRPGRSTRGWPQARQMVQQQALRDFARAMAAFFDPGNPAGRPSWRKAGRDEGFRIVGGAVGSGTCAARRKTGQVWVPKAGWVRFRWSRAVPPGVKSYRVSMDRAGRWHVAFAAIPDPVPAPGNGQAVGIDRGVAVSAALSTGELLRAPGLTAREGNRLRRLERKLARARRGSERRARVRRAVARLRARQTDRRKDWAEKVSTDIARRFDVIRVEDLQIANMTRSARGRGRTRAGTSAPRPGSTGASCGPGGACWSAGWRTRRLAGWRRSIPRITSQRCSACGQVDGSRVRAKPSSGAPPADTPANADVNAARNIAAGHAVTARGGDGVTRPVNREPQLLASLTGRE